MKYVTASEARKNWFRILDEVARGEVVVLERNGKKIVLRSEEDTDADAALPDYHALLQVPDADEADRWGWKLISPEPPSSH